MNRGRKTKVWLAFVNSLLYTVPLVLYISTNGRLIRKVIERKFDKYMKMSSMFIFQKVLQKFCLLLKVSTEIKESIIIA